MINTLRRKFVFVNMICVTLILTAVFGAFYYTSSNQLKSENMVTLEKALSFAELDMSVPYEISKKDESNKDYEASNFVINVDYDGKPTVAFANNINIDPDKMDQILPVNSKSINKALDTVVKDLDSGKTTGEFKKYRLRYMIGEASNGINIAFVDLTNEYHQRGQMLIACLVTGFVALCGFFLVSVLLSRWALRPVERAWNNQKQFAADASHELKTPLTVILANMEILKANKKQTIDERMAWVDNTEVEAKRMKSLANNLLFLAKNGDMKKPAITEKVNLSDVAMKSSLAFEPVAFENKVSIDMFIESDIFVGGDQEQMRQLINILLDNAVKYSFENTTIKIFLKEVSGKAVLEVNDTGVVISHDDLTNIFERFYRSDESRAEEGYGLGLSIANNIVDRHRGTITATSDESDGTTFIVSLPIYKS